MCMYLYSSWLSVLKQFYLCSCSHASVRLTWEVEAAFPMAFGRGVGRRSGTRGVALLEGCWRGRRGWGGGGWIAAGVQLIQHWRMILMGQGWMQTTPSATDLTVSIMLYFRQLLLVSLSFYTVTDDSLSRRICILAEIKIVLWQPTISGLWRLTGIIIQ